MRGADTFRTPHLGSPALPESPGGGGGPLERALGELSGEPGAGSAGQPFPARTLGRGRREAGPGRAEPRVSRGGLRCERQKPRPRLSPSAARPRRGGRGTGSSLLPARPARSASARPGAALSQRGLTAPAVPASSQEAPALS